MVVADTPTSVDQILAALPHLYRGPGGSAAIIKDGEVVGQRSWGYANLEKRAEMLPSTVLPVCSISKQMVCLTLVSLCRDPTPSMLMKNQTPLELLNAELKKMLPHVVGLPDGELRVDHLYNMQSGIRDYWAMTTLYGAHPEDEFSIALDAPQTLERTKSFHFKPGTEFSYSNVNFFVVGRIMERVSGQSLHQLLAERLFIPAGMSSAILASNMAGLPLPIMGYEGSEALGYFAAHNRIEWQGDAGIGASLDDMIAYEKYLDRSWSDTSSLYYNNAQPQKYNDGTPAKYGFGLIQGDVAGKSIVRHGGALRGFRLCRTYIPSERLSVVVMFNHDADGRSASDYIIKQYFGYKDPEPNRQHEPAAEWDGDFLDEEHQLHISVRNKGKDNKAGPLLIRHKGYDEYVELASPNRAETPNVTATIDGDNLVLVRADDNRTMRARRIKKPSDTELFNVKSADFVGSYRCAEVDSTMHLSGEGGTLYGSFEGFMGKGPIWLMRYIGEDVWILQNHRSLDISPPGDWTISFHRGGDGKVNKVILGCFLAWNIVYEKLHG